MKPATAGAGFIGGGVGLVIFLMSRGLPEETKLAVDELPKAVAAARADVAGDQQKLAALVAEDAAWLGARPEVAAARKAYDTRLAEIAQVEARIDKELTPLIKADDYDDRNAVAVLTTEIASRLVAKGSTLDQKLADVYRVRNYKRDHGKIVKGAREVLKRATDTMADPSLTAVVQKGQADYPDAAEKIQKRLETLTKSAGALAVKGTQFDAALQKQPIDYVEVGTLADSIQKDGRALIDGAASLRSDIASLGKSSDKILVDMKKDNGRCYHKYRYVEGGLARITGWEQVVCLLYDRHTDHLGMALYSKPEGTFESEATTVAHPPGYSYVGNTRYGYWDARPSGRFWVWYGQYALTRDLLWGTGGYRPLTHRTYSSYRTAVSKKRPYYGQTKQYGTNGSVTKKKYRSSTFLTRKRSYAASRFKTSGSSGYRDFKSGSGSGTSRTGGYRSNRYRSSSFGGSGK